MSGAKHKDIWSYSLRRSLPATLLLGVFASANWGCASAPSGGVSVPNTANRITATLTLQNNLDGKYYYAVAFDDHAGSDSGGIGDGPVAIVSGTPILNRVVGGNWRVAVLWHAGQFQVYRRGTPTDPDTESGSYRGALVSSIASGKTIQFTLNLDYKVDSSTRLFPLDSNGGPVQTYDVNFVTTDSISADTSDNTIKPVDSYGTSETSSPVTGLRLSGTTTRTFTDAQDDVNIGASRPVNFNFAQIDVVQFDLAANRTDAP